MWWQEPVTVLKGIGAKKAELLAGLGIGSVGELLEYYPRQEAYLDYSQVKKIGELATDGSKQLFRAEVCQQRQGFSGRRNRYTVVTVRDETGYADLYFFSGQRYAAQKLRPGDAVLACGRVKQGRSCKVVSEVDCSEAEAGGSAPGILPVYNLATGLSQKNLRDWLRLALAQAETELPETLPRHIIERYHFMERLQALRNIHFPQSWEKLAQAQKRFIFEEIFLLQCGLLHYRRQNVEERQGVAHQAQGTLLPQVLAALPFRLTPAQEKAWQEIEGDMRQERPMRRILQGDVGSGKTVVSALALAKACENGCQSCIMAPTEILAVQHYETLSQYLAPFGVRIALLKGGMRAKARRELLLELELGMIDVVVGTHALLQEDVVFKNLSLAVTDEQHRFGVQQRATLTDKARHVPDVLIMTATPIPRTLALTVYGDLDVSIMKGRPPGRKPVQTLCYAEDRRGEVYAGLVRQVGLGRQAYIVCPLVEAAENVAARSAEQVYEELKRTYLRDIDSALLHGRMRPAEKDFIMKEFSEGRLSVLVSTTVIEVGVNVPNATLMIVENAEFFGLAQLHQLRGRVGRGTEQSYCVLLAGNNEPGTLARLSVLHDSDDGFYLAEKDLELRGSGQLFGLRQHGLPDLHIADIMRDGETISLARQAAQELLQREHGREELQNLVEKQFGERFRMIFNT